MLNIVRRPAVVGEKLVNAVNPTLARVLAGRGIDDMAQMSLQTSDLLPSSDLLGLERAVLAIDKAIDDGRRLLIIGDFDCDGATSTALMVRVLRELGAVVDFLVPDRFYFGYGLTPRLAEHAKDVYAPDLIVTVDNGISSHDGVAVAKALGIDVIVTDHHLTTVANPDALAVVNPNQLDCPFASKALVGVGVAFYVMGSLARHRRVLGKSTTIVSRYLDLVALGTVADVGVFDKNNRILIHSGLERIRQGHCVPGILAILEQAGRQGDTITVTDLGFLVAPRINAAGRMDNMRIGIECLLTDDWQVAHEFAHQLDRLNKERRGIEEKMKEAAECLLANLSLDATSNKKQRSVVLYQNDWHQGVIGIVAGRIKERLYCPVVIFAPNDKDKLGDDDFIKGSARSIAGIHIRDVILQIAEENPNLICHFGGHAMAAGLTMYKKNFHAFAQAFEMAMAKFDDAVFSEIKYSDGVLLPQDVSLSFAEQLKNISVWGNGFAIPIFDGVFDVLAAKILKDKHLKLTLSMAGVQYAIDAIWFNYDNAKWDYRTSLVHILFELDINEWQGNQSVQLVIRDLAVIQIRP